MLNHIDYHYINYYINYDRQVLTTVMVTINSSRRFAYTYFGTKLCTLFAKYRTVHFVTSRRNVLVKRPPLVESHSSQQPSGASIDALETMAITEKQQEKVEAKRRRVRPKL